MIISIKMMMMRLYMAPLLLVMRHNPLHKKPNISKTRTRKAKKKILKHPWVWLPSVPHAPSLPHTCLFVWPEAVRLWASEVSWVRVEALECAVYLLVVLPTVFACVCA